MNDFIELPGGIGENFRFLVMDVTKQVEETLAFLAEPDPKLVKSINSRDDYIDNMKSLIEDKAYSFITSAVMEKKRANLMRSVNTISTNLERIADFAVNVVNQTNYLSDPKFLADYGCEPFFEEVLEGLSLIIRALSRHDLALAFRICQCEFHLDELFGERFERIQRELKSGVETGNLVTTIFIIRYLERMGDSLLNIGEAIIFAIMGERLKIHQYQALTDTLDRAGLETPISKVEFESIWGTRSGCRIGTVREESSDGTAQRVIFKEGDRGKLIAEKDNIERWQKLMPGLPPRIYGFQDNHDKASILLEYLTGCTLQEVLMNAEREILDNAMFLLKEHVSVIWRETLEAKPANSRFIRQLRARESDVYRVHPSFRGRRQNIGDLAIPSYDDKVEMAREICQALDSPFSLFIHGDFNVNNIIYDHNEQRLHYIDLHRSAYADYVQDVSVFMVSNFRIPVWRSRLRARLDRTILEFLEFAREFAQEKQDYTFDARLALGLVRSFFTSTRFELNARFANLMYLRSAYLLDHLLAHRGKPWEEYRLPKDVLIY